MLVMLVLSVGGASSCSLDLVDNGGVATQYNSSQLRVNLQSPATATVTGMSDKPHTVVKCGDFTFNIISTPGSCCWTLYTHSSRRAGSSQTVGPGSTTVSLASVGSLYTASCTM